MVYNEPFAAINFPSTMEPGQEERFKINKKTLHSLATKFLIIPSEMQNDLMYICWAIEKAHYHYLDELVVDRTLKLKACSFTVFAVQLIKFSPFLKTRIVISEETLNDYRIYRRKSRRCGAVLFSENKKVLLVKEKPIQTSTSKKRKGGKQEPKLTFYSFPKGTPRS